MEYKQSFPSISFVTIAVFAKISTVSSSIICYFLVVFVLPLDLERPKFALALGYIFKTIDTWIAWFSMACSKILEADLG